MTIHPIMPLRRASGPRINASELVMITVSGQACAPLQPDNPYRIGQDGMPRILPGTGGIVLSHRVGDPCVGVAGDHIEPSVSIRHEGRVRGGDGANLALQTYACIGNWAEIISGPCNGKRGAVIGKHGGIDTVIVEFPMEVMKRMRLGDRVQVYAYGLGARLLDHPRLTLMNSAPRLLDRWGLEHGGAKLGVPVTHIIPGELMGSGIGRNNAQRGDYDIQLFDEKLVRENRLGSLRFGDVVAVVNSDSRFGRSFAQGYVTIGVIVHSESTVAGHGPGVVTLVTGPMNAVTLRISQSANLAGILGLRTLPRAKTRSPLAIRERVHARRGGSDMPQPARPIGPATAGRRLA
jgi:Domain of unknown function (DUF4438)